MHHLQIKKRLPDGLLQIVLRHDVLLYLESLAGMLTRSYIFHELNCAKIIEDSIAQTWAALTYKLIDFILSLVLSPLKETGCHKSLSAITSDHTNVFPSCTAAACEAFEGCTETPLCVRLSAGRSWAAEDDGSAPTAMCGTVGMCSYLQLHYSGQA